MTRKKPFSGKAKKQQLQEKRERHRQRRDQSDDDAHAPDADISAGALTPSVLATATPVVGFGHGFVDDETAVVQQQQRKRGDLRTFFAPESKVAIEARKRDATRALAYSPNRGNSQSIYVLGIHETTNQPPILLKPQWSYAMTPIELVAAEDAAYRRWIESLDTLQAERGVTCNLFERNIEVWRQLWRTLERADVVVHLADARCPVIHLSDQLLTHVQAAHATKRIIIVLTKADIVSSGRVEEWVAYLQQRYDNTVPVVTYNRADVEGSNHRLLRCIGDTARAIDEAARETLRREDLGTLTIGCVGEPNVGKSSLLNSLFGRKLVSVSATPGHTKHLQTHYFDHPELLGCHERFPKVLVCDCPGVVFPRWNVPVALQVLFGSFPIAQVREPYSAIRFIAENCVPSMDEVYKLRPIEEDDDEWTPYTLCEAYAKQRGFYIRGGKLDVNRAANQILRDTLAGNKVVLSFPVPTN